MKHLQFAQSDELHTWKLPVDWVSIITWIAFKVFHSANPTLWIFIFSFLVCLHPYESSFFLSVCVSVCFYIVFLLKLLSFNHHHHRHHLDELAIFKVRASKKHSSIRKSSKIWKWFTNSMIQLVRNFQSFSKCWKQLFVDGPIRWN